LPPNAAPPASVLPSRFTRPLRRPGVGSRTPPGCMAPRGAGSRWTTTRSAGGDACFLAKEQSWRTAWRARSLLSRTISDRTARPRRDCRLPPGNAGVCRRHRRAAGPRPERAWARRQWRRPRGKRSSGAAPAVGSGRCSDSSEGASARPVRARRARFLLPSKSSGLELRSCCSSKAAVRGRFGHALPITRTHVSPPWRLRLGRRPAPAQGPSEARRAKPSHAAARWSSSTGACRAASARARRPARAGCAAAAPRRDSHGGVSSANRTARMTALPSDDRPVAGA
jgi:hypothetical protein